jgi:signal transduction histidine kinase/ligand-binding sensor domain-containing protein/DNA-binding response OmpR family regulator
MKMRFTNHIFCTVQEYLVKIFIVCILSFFNSALLFPQDNSIVFSHIDVNDGLSENWIKCIFKDSKGFIWFGTNSGLNRFDGYKFEVFQKNDSDPGSISDNFINAITEDNQGNLWVGTGNGLNVLDHETYKFKKVNLSPSLPLLCPDIGYITVMTAGYDGDILVGTHNGLFHINNKTNSFSHLLIDVQSCSSQLNNITAVTQDKMGSFWIGTENGFLVRYNENSNSFEKFKSIGEGKNLSGSINKIFADRNNFLWVADQAGLHLFDIGNNKWNKDLLKRFGDAFKNLQITGIDEDIDHQIWITTDGKGAFVIDPDKLSYMNVLNTPYAEGSLSSNGLYSLFCDNSGIIWLGSSKKGVDFYKRNVRKFRVLKNLPADPNSLNNNDVNCITEDSDGNIIIGTNGGGLNFYDRKTGKFSHLTSQPGKTNSLSSNIIVSVFEDQKKKIWIGTYLGGLNLLDPETGKIKVYRHNDSDSNSISDDRVWGICEDSRKNIWVVTLANGLNLFDRESEKFRVFNTQNSPICFNYLNSISVDENDNLWLSSANGLIYYDPVQKRSKCYYNDPENPSSISANHIVSTFRDSRGMFWICTTNGLNLMDPVKDNFRIFREKDGLPSDRVLRILEDNNSDLWVSTKNGISKLIIGESKETGSRTYKFVNYGLSDGLQGKEFNETSALKTTDGELWFGGPDGLNVFLPPEIKEDSTPARIILTDLRIDNKTIKYGEYVNKRILLDKPVFSTDELILKYKENSITLDFVALNYFFPEKNEYSYNLEGLNDKWINTRGKENFAVFSNLKNGNYIFRVKCTNSDGVWNQDAVSLKIKVLPPFWKSMFAYLVYFVLISSLLAILRFLTLSRERIKARLEQEKIESQHTHEIDSMKIKFFTNISHEFRTPLTLILSPVEMLMMQWKGKPEEKYLHLIVQNARRLLFMVNELLDFRKMEVQGFVYNPSLGDIIAVIEGSVSSFQDLADQRHIKLNFHSDIPEFNTFFDKDKLEKILLNLLSNAFKFTHTNGCITVSVLPHEEEYNKVNEKPSRVIIKVKDTGMGIPQDKINNLFSDFYQPVSSVSGDMGTGIGLSLVKEFTKLHGGEISVESVQGKGSCFTVSLPVAVNKKSHNNDFPEDGIELFDDKPSGILSNEADFNKKEKPVLLIAEDNDDLRFYMKDNLQTQYDVYEAADGEEALCIILKVIPDLIISDIIMPRLTGVELCKRIKNDKRTSHIPFILLTARSNPEAQFEDMETGADDYIIKPFNFQILEARISNLINTRRNLRLHFTNNLNIEPKDITITSLDEQFVQKSLDLVEKNISNADYTVEELSRDLGMSRTLLYKKIIALTGKSPLEFIRSLRLKRAAQLLQKSQLNVSEVAFRVGFNDPKYFRKHFKNEYGMIPSLYSEQFKLKQ